MNELNTGAARIASHMAALQNGATSINRNGHSESGADDGEARDAGPDPAGERESASDLLGPMHNDNGNSERLKAYTGETIRYCYAFRKWLIYDGSHWGIDKTGQIFKLAKAVVLEFFRQAGAAKNDAAEKFARQSLDSRRLTSMIGLAECELPITPDELDTDPYLLNFRNGTVDLRTGTLRKHSPADFITKVIGYDFDSLAKCGLWLATLHRLMGGGPDAPESALERADRLVAHLQKAFGYSATGITSEKVVFVPYGGGSNGKTMSLTTISRCLGDYASVVLIDSIMSRQESSNASADLADLLGARFVMTSETEEGQRLAEGKLKRLTQGIDGARIRACKKYENPITFLESHKLWIDCNHKPVVRGTDAAIWNRIHLIPFTVTIPQEEIDRELPSKLMKEAKGILSWIVAGAVRWHREGLGKPLEVADAVREYRDEMDQIGRFVEECCVAVEYASAKGRELYTSYRKWADESGENTITEMAFALKLKERGFEKRHTDSGARYSGIGLRNG